MTTNDTRAPAEVERTDPLLLDRGVWKVVREGSTVGFKVKKMGLYHVKGRFRDFDGHLEIAPDWPSPRGELTIEAASISTRMPPRDWHLRTRDFLGVKEHPRIRVRADRIEAAGDQGFHARATIEIKGRATLVDLWLHRHSGPDGKSSSEGRARIHLGGVIDRHEFGIRATRPAEWVVASEVHIDVELTLQRVG